MQEKVQMRDKAKMRTMDRKRKMVQWKMSRKKIMKIVMGRNQNKGEGIYGRTVSAGRLL